MARPGAAEVPTRPAVDHARRQRAVRPGVNAPVFPVWAFYAAPAGAGFRSASGADTGSTTRADVT